MKALPTFLLAISALLAGCNASQSQPEPATTVTEAAPANTETTPEDSVPAEAIASTDAVESSKTAEPTDAGHLASNTTEVTPQSLDQYHRSLSRRCETDSDCTVKNVGNCCGYAPQCVHKDVQTFPEQVKALCEKEGRNSICGFQEPAGCSCVDNQCRNAANSEI